VDLDQAPTAIDAWVRHYNQERPHQGIGMVAPFERFQLADPDPFEAPAIEQTAPNATGRPRRYGHDERLKIVATATSMKPEWASHWSHALLADVLSDMGSRIAGGADPRGARHPIAPGALLAGPPRRPHVLGTGRGHVWPLPGPTHERVGLSVDEKTAIPARSRKHPTKPVAPGRPERQEFEYRRHGTACLIAALNVHTGEVIATDTPRNNSANFIAFLEQLDASVPKRKKVHLVLDNGSSHVSKATKAWLAEHPRFVAHYTPKHASWLNQVELFFSILTRRLLRRGEFDSRDDLVHQIMGFIREHNRTAKPIRWTYDGTPLKAA
jgi:transposase